MVGPAGLTRGLSTRVGGYANTVLDAIVVGAGHNGLVAANILSDAGWDVMVVEAGEVPGGAVRSGEITIPGFTHDLFSAFYPLVAASPVFRELELERFGLRWRKAPLVLAHPTEEGCVALSTDLDETAESLERFAAGDGSAWRDLYALWVRLGDQVMEALLRPFPPVTAASRLAARLRRDLLRFARFAILPARTLAGERFRGPGGALLLSGNAMHADLSPESVLSGFFGWLLASLGQQQGFPVPEGGAARLIDALVARLESRGGRVECNTPIERVVVREGRAAGVRTHAGDELGVRRAILADVAAPALYLDLVGGDELPPQFTDDLKRFQWDNATVKVDWALKGPIPWSYEEARRAGTIHVSRSFDDLSEFSAHMAMGYIPARPFLIMGQLSGADPTRSPTGTETAWAYTHVPFHVRGDMKNEVNGRWDEREREAFVRRMEDEIELQAPGFRDLIVGRHVFAPPDFAQENPSLVHGAFNAGTAQLYQQLIFRPTPGLARAETPIAGLYLASASAHPGGGVHGAPGANAARAALAWSRGRRRMIAAGAGAALAGCTLRAAARGKR